MPVPMSAEGTWAKSADLYPTKQSHSVDLPLQPPQHSQSQHQPFFSQYSQDYKTQQAWNPSLLYTSQAEQTPENTSLHFLSQPIEEERSGFQEVNYPDTGYSNNTKNITRGPSMATSEALSIQRMELVETTAQNASVSVKSNAQRFNELLH